MDLICYAATNCPGGTHVLTQLEEEAPVGRTVLCRTIEELDRSLLRPLDDVLAVLLFLADDADLARILTLKDVLDETRVILILPRWDPDLVTGGHFLRPRFMTCRGLDLAELRAVLN